MTRGFRMSLSVQLMFKFPHHIVMAMAAVMAAFGIASITLAIMSFTFGVWGNYWGTGIWCGAVVFIGGINGVVATHFRNSCCIKSYLILSIIGAVTSLAMLALSAGGLDYSSGFYKIQHDHSQNDFRTKVIYGCSLGCAIVQLVLCVTSTGVCTYFIFIDKETVSYPTVKKQKNEHHKRNMSIRNSQTSISSRSPLVSKNVKSEAKNIRKSSRTCAENRDEVNQLPHGRRSQRRSSRWYNASERNQSDVNDRSCGRPPTFSTFGHLPEDEYARNVTSAAEVIASVPQESQAIQAQAPESSRINSSECLWEPTLPIEEDEELPPYQVLMAEDHCDLNAGSQPQCGDNELSSSSSESNISPLHRTHNSSLSQKAQDGFNHTDLTENPLTKHSYTYRAIDGRMTISDLGQDENKGHYSIHMPTPSSQGSREKPGQLQRSVTKTSPYIHTRDKQPIPYNHDLHPQGVSYHGFKRDGDQIVFEESRKPPVRSQSLRLPLEHHRHYFRIPSEQNLDNRPEVDSINSISAQDVESHCSTQGSWNIAGNDLFPQRHSANQVLRKVPLHNGSFYTFKNSSQLPVKADISPKPPTLNPLSRGTDIIKRTVPQDVDLEEIHGVQESDQAMKHLLPLNIVGNSLSQNTDKVFKQNSEELQGNKIKVGKDYNNCENYSKAKEMNKMGIFNKDKTKDIDQTQDARHQMNPSWSVMNKESFQIQTIEDSKSDQTHINSKQGGVRHVSLNQALSRSSPLSPILPSIPKACVTLPRHSSTSLFKPVNHHSHQGVISPIPTQCHFLPISVAQEPGRKCDQGLSSTSQALREPSASFADAEEVLNSDDFDKDSSHQKPKQDYDMDHVGNNESRVQKKPSHPEKDQIPERIQGVENVIYESSNVSPPSNSSASCGTSHILEDSEDINDLSKVALGSWSRDSAGLHEARNLNGARPKTSRTTSLKDLPVLFQAGKSYVSSNKKTSRKEDISENTPVIPQENLSVHILIGRPLSREEILPSQSQQGNLKVRLPVHREGRISAPPVVRQNSMPLGRPVEPKQNSGSSQLTDTVSDRFGFHISAGARNRTQGVLLLRRQQSYQESIHRQHEDRGHGSCIQQAHPVRASRSRHLQQHPHQGPQHHHQQQQPPPTQQHLGRQPLYSVLL